MEKKTERWTTGGSAPYLGPPGKNKTLRLWSASPVIVPRAYPKLTSSFTKEPMNNHNSLTPQTRKRVRFHRSTDWLLHIQTHNILMWGLYIRLTNKELYKYQNRIR